MYVRRIHKNRIKQCRVYRHGNEKSTNAEKSENIKGAAINK